jgi:hypothetical protein
MSRKGKVTLSSLGLLLRISIAVIFLLGVLPIPVMAIDNGTVTGQVTDNSTGNPI